MVVFKVVGEKLGHKCDIHVAFMSASGVFIQLIFFVYYKKKNILWTFNFGENYCLDIYILNGNNE